MGRNKYRELAILEKGGSETMFETLEGKEIKRIEIDVIRLEELFERYALDFPYQYLSNGY